MKRNKKKPANNTANPYSPRTVWVLYWVVADERAVTCLDTTSFTEADARKNAAKAWDNQGFLRSEAVHVKKFGTTMEAVAFLDSIMGLGPGGMLHHGQ